MNVEDQGQIPTDHKYYRDGEGGPRRREFMLAIGALGVVFGDIGTSPLYALRTSVLSAQGHAAPEAAVMGALSLIFWALIIVVTIKYVALIMRADNNGEGGVLALAALAHRSGNFSRPMKTAIGVAAVIGLALFVGDGMITPAISVLSALEGLSVESSAFTPLVLPISLIVLIGLFLMQSRGTAKIGRLFGPIMVVWFICLGVLGLVSILKSPSILAA
ncbi:MAG TPA: KUP/HAK/KT family potassium transporter, partial [Rhizomicrobium sp.]